MSSSSSFSSDSIVINPESIDHASNPSARVPVAILCDTSASMSGAPLAALQSGLQTLFSEIGADMKARLCCDPTIFRFGGGVEQVMPWEAKMVGMTPIPELTASGNTPLGEAVNTAIEAIHARQTVYRRAAIPSYRPWIVIFSDGAPTDEWQTAASKLSTLATEKRWNVICVGTGPAVDLKCLARFSPERPPLHIRSASDSQTFVEFFRWLSTSIKITSRKATSADPQMAMLPPCIDIVG